MRQKRSTLISRVKDMSEWKKWSIKWFITVIVFIIVSFLLLVRIAKWTGFELADWPSIMILIEVMVGVAIYAGIASRKTDASEKMKRQAIWACSIFVLVLAGLFILHIIDLIRVGEIIEIIVLFGLVLITAEYARHTRIMAKEMRKQRYSECLPLLLVAINQGILPRGLDPDKHLYSVLQTGIGATFEWCNSGKGVAVNVRFSLWGLPLDSHPGKVLFFPPRESKALEVGAHVSIVFDYAGQWFDQPEVYCPRLEAEYQDIYERSITTVQEFCFDAQKKTASLGDLYFTVNGRRLGEEIIRHD